MNARPMTSEHCQRILDDVTIFRHLAVESMHLPIFFTPWAELSPDRSAGRTVTRLDRMCLCGLNPVPWSQGTQLPEVLFFIIFPDSDKILCNYVLIWEKIFVFLYFLYFLNHFLIMNRKREKLCTFERSQLKQFSTYIKFYFTNAFITLRGLGEYTIF